MRASEINPGAAAGTDVTSHLMNSRGQIKPAVSLHKRTRDNKHCKGMSVNEREKILQTLSPQANSDNTFPQQHAG